MQDRTGRRRGPVKVSNRHGPSSRSNKERKAKRLESECNAFDTTEDKEEERERERERDEMREEKRRTWRREREPFLQSRVQVRNKSREDKETYPLSLTQLGNVNRST